jgi:flavorubredoxin
VKIHQTLMEAIEHLTDSGFCWGEDNKKLYSCDAVQSACYAEYSFTQNARDHFTECKDFMRELGVSTCGLNEFDDICPLKHRQFARALWLTWAAMIAKEMNL